MKSGSCNDLDDENHGDEPVDGGAERRPPPCAGPMPLLDLLNDRGMECEHLGGHPAGRTAGLACLSPAIEGGRVGGVGDAHGEHGPGACACWCPALWTTSPWPWAGRARSGGLSWLVAGAPGGAGRGHGA